MKNVNKYLQIILIVALMLMVFGVCASAEGYTSPEQIIDDYSAILPDGVDLPLDEGVVSSLGIDALLYEIIASFRGQSGKIISFFLMLVGAAVLIALAGQMQGEIAPILRAAVSGISALAVFSRILPLISEISSSLSLISGFFSALIPILCVAEASGGGTLAAGTGAVGMAVTLDLCALFTERVLGLLVFATFLSGIASSFGGGIAVISRGIKNTFTRGIGIVSVILLGTLALQTLISSTGDNMAIRAARYATSGFIPVVGSTVAGALSTLVGGVAYAKGVVGGSAIAVIVTFAIAPLVLLLSYRLCFFIVLSFMDFIGAGDGAGALAGVRDALDGLISVFALISVVYVLEISIMLALGVRA